MLAVTFQRGSISPKGKEKIREDAQKSGHGVVFIEYAKVVRAPTVMIVDAVNDIVPKP